MGKLSRFEFIEYFVRMGRSSFPNMAPSLSLMIFLELFLKPLETKSRYLKEREAFKGNMPLNKNLYENRMGIQYIFDKLRGDEEMVPKAKISDYM